MESTLSKADTRRLLFDAMRASPEARVYFVQNIDNAELLQILFEIALDDMADTVRLQACYCIAQFSEHLLHDYEEPLLRLQNEAWESISEHAIVALSKTRSKKSLLFLIEKRIAPKLSWEAKMLHAHLQDILKE